MLSRERIEEKWFNAVKIAFCSNKETTIKNMSIEEILHLQDQIYNYPKQTILEIRNTWFMISKIESWTIGFGKEIGE